MRWCLVLTTALVSLAACGGGGGEPQAQTQLGDPNPGLSAAQLASFERGRALFEKRFTRAEGHGPDFNTTSCKSCHGIPVTGGSSPLYRNFILAAHDDGSTLTAPFELGQFVQRRFSHTRAIREAVTPDIEVVTQRNAPPMFGMGQLDSITSDDILANADPLDGNADGISGRANLDGTFVSRFGFKAQESSLEEFIRAPIFTHMGITSEPLSFGPQTTGLRVERQVTGDPNLPTIDADGVNDPELSFQELFDLVFYVSQLAPPAPLPLTTQSGRGQTVFGEIGCAQCHIPNIKTTGAPVNAYTDLLLHDMGPGLADGMRQGAALGSEFRTQPLWGLRHHAPYLHDGRADTIRDAIDAHGGEAAPSRTNFLTLPTSDQDALIAFLETR